jgi:hypothetical protein
VRRGYEPALFSKGGDGSWKSGECSGTAPRTQPGEYLKSARLKIARHVTPFFHRMISSGCKEQMRVFAASAQPERAARISSILPAK